MCIYIYIYHYIYIYVYIYIYIYTCSHHYYHYYYDHAGEHRPQGGRRGDEVLFEYHCDCVIASLI